MLPNINCDTTKAATNVTVDYSFIHKKWRKYLATLKDFMKISYYKVQLFSKISILLQDAVTSKRKVSYWKTPLLISVSKYYLQDAKIRYCLSLLKSLPLENTDACTHIYYIKEHVLTS